jgi:hypothetical protein
VPSQLTEEQQAQHLTLTDVKVRNSIAIRGWEQLMKSSPPPLMSAACANLVRLGNFEDDLSCISEADWVIEAVVEDIQIKRSYWNESKFCANPTHRQHQHFRHSHTLLPKDVLIIIQHIFRHYSSIHPAI